MNTKYLKYWQNTDCALRQKDTFKVDKYVYKLRIWSQYNKSTS